MHFDCVCFHSAMKHENGVSNVVRLSPSSGNLQYAIRLSSFSSVNNENDNFIKEIKHVVRSSIAC